MNDTVMFWTWISMMAVMWSLAIFLSVATVAFIRELFRAEPKE